MASWTLVVAVLTCCFFALLFAVLVLSVVAMTTVVGIQLVPVKMSAK